MAKIKKPKVDAGVKKPSYEQLEARCRAYADGCIQLRKQVEAVYRIYGEQVQRTHVAENDCAQLRSDKHLLSRLIMANLPRDRQS